MSGPLIVGNLRPDLTGGILRLNNTDTSELRTGEEATLQVAGVYDAGDPDCVRVRGLWCGPDGVRKDAAVLIKATSLPVYTAGIAEQRRSYPAPPSGVSR